MAELLPEFWGSTSGKEASQPSTSRAASARRKRAVTDIATWVQCFATYISVMSTSHPGAVPELLAYLIFILRVSQDFGGVAWVTYDAAFRRQALITGNRHWSRVNPSLYSICFSGVARTGQRCDLCLSLSHPTRECTLVSDPDPDLTTRLRTLESAVLALSSSPSTPAPSASHTQATEVSRNFNVGRCRMPNCRYRHVCRVCGGPRPAVTCCERQLGVRVSTVQSATRATPAGTGAGPTSIVRTAGSGESGAHPHETRAILTSGRRTSHMNSHYSHLYSLNQTDRNTVPLTQPSSTPLSYIHSTSQCFTCGMISHGHSRLMHF